MKNIKLTLFLSLILTVVFSSCYKEESWVDKNVKESLGSVPFIQGLSIDNVPESGMFIEGSVAQIALQYWSIDDVKNIEVFATIDGQESLSETHPFIDSYNDELAAQLQMFDYTIPAGTSGMTIDLRVVVNTDRDLFRDKTVTISVE
ncbi:MAG: hypothetical protein V3V14_08780 [Saprospiraceae bacterium]